MHKTLFFRSRRVAGSIALSSGVRRKGGVFYAPVRLIDTKRR